jgi:hypothetical protein
MNARALPALLLVSACSAAAPAPPVDAPPADAVVAQKAADVALGSLTKRKYNTAGCVATDARLVPEAEAVAPTSADERCQIRVARRADRTWVVVVRSPAQRGDVTATVQVSAGAEGVLHIDYKP